VPKRKKFEQNILSLQTSKRRVYVLLDEMHNRILGVHF